MIDQNFITQLSSKAAALFPVAKTARDKLEADLRQLLQRSLAGLQLVSKEEFDAQLAVLERANQRIGELEEKLARLEEQNFKQG